MNALLQCAVYLGVLLLLVKPLGAYMFRVFEGDRQPLGYTTFDALTHSSNEQPEHPVSTPDPGDPTYLDPKTAAMVREFLTRMRGLRRRPER